MTIDLIKENGSKLKKARSRQYPAETITDADYADDLVLLANTLTQAESLLHSLEQVAGGIGLHRNTNKMKYMHFKQEEAISTLSGKLLKLVDKFTYLGSSISSTESDVNICLAKVWSAIHKLWKSDLSNKIKQDFFQVVALMILLYGCTSWTPTKCMEKNYMGTTQECYKLH